MLLESKVEEKSESRNLKRQNIDWLLPRQRKVVSEDCGAIAPQG